MFDPVTNLISTQAARRAAMARRPQEQRTREAEKGGRTEDFGDSYENAIGQVEATSETRRLADADQEDAREDRLAREGMPETQGRPADPERPGLDLTA